jgi:hypothetical protein
MSLCVYARLRAHGSRGCQWGAKGQRGRGHVLVLMRGETATATVMTSVLLRRRGVGEDKGGGRR